MSKLTLSPKRLQIDKANSTVVAAIAIAVFLLVFALITSRELLSTRSYQDRVITKKETAKRQLEDNKAAVQELEMAYRVFVENPENIIGGLKDGTSDRDGDNAKIVLDALPSKYDFPALATSIEKLANQAGLGIIGIEGDDAEVSLTGDTAAPVAEDGVNPEADQTTPTNSGAAATQSTTVEMPFSVSVQGGYDASYNLLKLFELSIRPIAVQSISYSAQDDGAVVLKVGATTYILPEKTLKVTSEVVQ
jgi:Tfp pilus assembly protein PilO